MTNELKSLMAELKTRGPQEFAAWDDAAFDVYCDRPLRGLLSGLEWTDKKSTDATTPANYIRLVFEGVGAGWLTSQTDEETVPTFLAHLLGMLVPYRLSDVAARDRAEVLRTIWNIGEGLAQEPLWLNRYAIAETDWSLKLDQLTEHMERILAPVLSEQPAAAWQGGFHVQILDTRNISDAFIPGRMYLAAPTVLCVENSIGSETLAILLQKKAGSRMIGCVPKLPEYSESFETPDIQTATDSVSINSTQVDLPLIGSPQQTFCASAGYLSVTTDNSQRLWLVDTA